MKRALIGVITALSLALGAGVAQAHGPGDWGHWGDGGGGQSSSTVVAVAGVVTAVDPSTSSFTANAFVPQGEGDGWHHGYGGGGGSGSGDQGSQGNSAGQGNPAGQGSQGNPAGQGSRPGDFHADWLGAGPPSLSPVTITTDGSTTFRIDGQDSSLTSLPVGSRFVALFNGSPTDSLQTLVASPAVAVFAHTPPTQHQLYAFVGTVSGVDPTAGTVTVQVANALPTGLVPAGSAPMTFTVSAGTMILGGSATNGLFGGSLTDVSLGDVVAGGLIGPAGEALTQVQASPLQVLVDFPAAATPSVKSSSLRRSVRQRALSQALALFGVKARATGHGHKAHAHHHGRHRSSRTHSRRTRK